MSNKVWAVQFQTWLQIREHFTISSCSHLRSNARPAFTQSTYWDTEHIDMAIHTDAAKHSKNYIAWFQHQIVQTGISLFAAALNNLITAISISSGCTTKNTCCILPVFPAASSMIMVSAYICPYWGGDGHGLSLWHSGSSPSSFIDMMITDAVLLHAAPHWIGLAEDLSLCTRCVHSLNTKRDPLC